jgi:lysyl-tRNA synthetase class I
LKEKHEKIKDELKDKQKMIAEIAAKFQSEEWQYEVKLQQFQYLKQERDRLFDQFYKVVYEIHQKTGLRNLILEKKLETIEESLETKDAQIN